MEFYTLEKRYAKHGVFDGFHWVLFHGDADYRERSREKPMGVTYWLGKVGTHSLEITLGGMPVPPIFMPQTHLIVCQKTRDQLRAFKNLEFLPVVLKKLVGVNFPKGDFPYLLRLKGVKSFVAIEKLQRVGLPKGGFKHLIRLKRVPLPVEIKKSVDAQAAKGKPPYRGITGTCTE